MTTTNSKPSRAPASAKSPQEKTCARRPSNGTEPPIDPKVETAQVVDQNLHPAVALIAARPELFARQGAVVATWRRHGAQTCGPYYRLSYREDGRQCSVYLGRAGAVVDRVRDALADLQRRRNERHARHRMRRQVVASLRRHKKQLNRQLLALGLRLHGFEVRGWRASPMRAAFAAARCLTWPRPSAKLIVSSVLGPRGLPLRDRPYLALAAAPALESPGGSLP